MSIYHTQKVSSNFNFKLSQYIHTQYSNENKIRSADSREKQPYCICEKVWESKTRSTSGVNESHIPPPVASITLPPS